MFPLVDSYDRRFVYLRLSVTERCNFRCVYCLPQGYVAADAPAEPELGAAEIRRMVAGFAQLGVWKVRLTGGEPTVRRDLVELVRTVASVPGIRQIGLTTNGHRLTELALPLRRAGLTSVNISLDSLDPKRFHEITGTDRFEQVMSGIDQALSVGFQQVKINAVLMRDTNADELQRFMEWVKLRPVSVRFIELMRTGKNSELFEKRHLSGGVLQFELKRSGWSPEARRSGDGPAIVYRHPQFAGSVGIIAPYSPDFCQSCNRLRVSSRGALRLCLFGEKDVALREYLQQDSSQDELVAHVRSLVAEKPISHALQEGKYGNTWNLASIGG